MTSRTVLLSAALAAAALTLAACGGEDTADETSDESTASGGGDMLSAYVSCIEEQGIDLPDDFAEGFGGGGEMPGFDPENAPSDMPTDMPTDMPSDMPSGGFGGGGFEAPEGVSDEDWQAAQDACAGELPSGGGGASADDLAAYRDCLAERGVELGDDPAALDESDPTVAAAMEECAALAPDAATDTES
ncbi:hypothetical protein [Glycomyces albidus]|uniref:Uncharacterized protein n=1 Tax=Glycomyces albidus TaxID=2656774 RepID=A0A6L5G803_9ACTN|nr:hypothetical protein [Glycomyces albidus]MQM25792.1 hypothetical protein [Glycomyces albidus]